MVAARALISGFVVESHHSNCCRSFGKMSKVLKLGSRDRVEEFGRDKRMNNGNTSALFTSRWTVYLRSEKREVSM